MASRNQLLRIQKGFPMSSFVVLLRFVVLFAGLSGVIGISAVHAENAPDHVVAKINKTDITEADIATALADLGDSIQQIPEAQRREYAISYIADLRLGAKAARDAKLSDDPDFKRRLGYQTDRMLFEEFNAAEAKKIVTLDAMKALYADTVKTLKPETEVRASHILVETEEQAKEIGKRLKAGEDFAKLATELSKDPGSGKQGGDLGFFTKERMVPEFSTAAFALEIGQVSEPVKSQFGFHVIKMTEKREKPVPSFDEVKDQIEQFMFRRAQQETIQKLRATAQIERIDPPTAPAAQ
jgi:peptidyl-prolyl cis-trans isomerase C